MEDNLLPEEFNKTRASKKGARQTGASPLSGSASGSRRTRSHLAPEWSVQDMLILVNEIAAIEGDCKNALSSYQKWTMIAENCAALDLARTSNQCRRKWVSLMDEYRIINEWESNPHSESYWSLSLVRRKCFRLPLDFNVELYDAIDTLVQLQQDLSDTDPDSGPETSTDVLPALENGSTKSRLRSEPAKGIVKYVASPWTGCGQESLDTVKQKYEEHVAKAGHDSSNKTRRQAISQKGIIEHVATTHTGHYEDMIEDNHVMGEDHVAKVAYETNKNTRRGAINSKKFAEHVPSTLTRSSVDTVDTEEEQSTRPGHDFSKKSIHEALSLKGITEHVATPQNGHREPMIEDESAAKVGHETSKDMIHQPTPQKSINEQIAIALEEIINLVTTPQTDFSERILTENHAVVEEHVGKAALGSCMNLGHGAMSPGYISEYAAAAHVMNDPRGAEGGSDSAIATAGLRERVLREKLMEDARVIHAILAGNMRKNVGYGLADLKNEAWKTEEARCKADELNAYFAVLNRNLEQLVSMVEGGQRSE